MVREGGLEPPHPKAPDPKSGASANSATPARGLYFVRNRHIFIIGPSDWFGLNQASFVDTASSGWEPSPADLRKPRPPVSARTTMKSADPTRTIIVPDGTSA